MATARDPRADNGWEPLARRCGLSLEELHLVRRSPVFAGLFAAAVAPLLEGAVAKSFARDALLFLQGEPATRFFVVLEGWVRLYRQTPQGQEVTIAVFGRGDSFAEAVVLQAMPFPVSAQAIAASRLLVVPADSVMRQLRESTELCFTVMAAMSRRLHDLVSQLENVSSRSTVQRLALFLLRLCGDARGECWIELPLDKNLIAARLGMQPETLSRCLAKLRSVGIESVGHQLHIADIARLRAIVAQDAASPL